MSVLHITKENFQDEVLNSHLPVLIDFWATWCGPCRMIAPVIEDVAEEREDIKVCKINVDDEPELANTFRIMSIPTLVVMDQGQEKTRALGARPKEAVLEMLQF